MAMAKALIFRETIHRLERIGLGYVLLLLGLVGLVGWGASSYLSQQWTRGLWVTGMNTPAYWGIYIVNFVLFIGLSAGGILVAALVHAVGIERFRPVARIAEILAISCLVLATVFIMLDLGRPERFFHLLLYGRMSSPLVWDVIVINVYLAISMALGYFSTRADLIHCMRELPRRRWLYRMLSLGYTDLSPQALERDHRILRTLAFAAIPAAIGLHSVTAWIFGLVKARPGWHSALIAPLFVVSAIVSGLALVIVAVVVSRRAFRLPIADHVVKDLGLLLAFLIPVLGYFLFAELLTVVYAREPAPLAVFREMMVGSYAPIFWFNLLLGLLLPLLVLMNPPRRVVLAGSAVATGVVAIAVTRFEIPLAGLLPFLPTQVALGIPPTAIVAVFWAFGLALPLLLLVSPKGLTPARIGIAAALVVLGVVAERTNIVLPPLLERLMPYPAGPGYFPTLVEISIVVGTYALGVLAFAFLAKLFPLVELSHEEREAA
ncbi:MAG: polysulfide reductase NrfD [candidate division NC10 bacterium]|nr:polysulfide reductase NrfD [candidate division NC10 bacterium]